MPRCLSASFVTLMHPRPVASRLPTRPVVEHAVSGVHLNLAAVHHDGHGDDDLLLGMSEDLVQAGLEVEQLRRAIKARHHRFKWIFFLVEEAVFVRPNDTISRK